jgi:acyl-CoA reductase-like NAD-dependent aldehyde dehydrogenase
MSNTFQTISPIDNSVYVERAFTDGKAIEQTLAAAKSAQKAWQATSVTERAAICQKVVDYFVEHADAVGGGAHLPDGAPHSIYPF